MEKFTKGPWFYEAATGDVHSNNYTDVICNMMPTGDKEFDANAALIAAAPEMYEQLQEVSNWLNSQLGFGDWHKEIEKLLAKARGEQ